MAEPTLPAELTWTVTARYVQCGSCHHPGPPEGIAALTIGQLPGAESEFSLTPHSSGCPMPAPFVGPCAHVVFHGEVTSG